MDTQVLKRHLMHEQGMEILKAVRDEQVVGSLGLPS